MELNYCRRCGQALKAQGHGRYVCRNGHDVFANAAPAMGVLLVNDRREVLLAVRAVEPGKGKYDMPGGFCEPGESFEGAAARELEEELGLQSQDYGPLQYLLSHAEKYEYGGESNMVLGAVYWARLQPGVKLRPGDDVAEAVLLRQPDIDNSRLAFVGLKRALQRLQDLGVI